MKVKWVFTENIPKILRGMKYETYGIESALESLTAPDTVRSPPPPISWKPSLKMFHLGVSYPRLEQLRKGFGFWLLKRFYHLNNTLSNLCFTFWCGNLAKHCPFFPLSWGQVYERKIDGNDKRLISRKRQLTFLRRTYYCKITCENRIALAISASIAIIFLQVPQERHLRLLYGEKVLTYA